MSLLDLCPLITAADIAAQRDFYVRRFGGKSRFMVHDPAGILIGVVE